VLGRLEEFPDGEATPLTVQADGRDLAILVVRQGGTLRAWRDLCPHQFLPLTWRGRRVLSADSTRIRCSNHAAEFCALDGRALTGPGDGSGLTPVTLRIAPDGTVHLDETEEETP
jgi:nitrite reductase/ring-hydroxylating ferredoxin subunit